MSPQIDNVFCMCKALTFVFYKEYSVLSRMLESFTFKTPQFII